MASGPDHDLSIESDIEKPTPDVREIRIFLCYRRKDGAWYANWLFRHLTGAPFVDATGKLCNITVYYDKAAPGVSDWKKLHFPSLQTSQALILICTPGIATDLSGGQSDWVYEELRWWRRHRKTAPIVVDSTGEGDRWLPKLIARKWPHINRIDLNKDEATAAESAGTDFATQIRERILGTIRETEQVTTFQDLQRLRRLSRRVATAWGGGAVAAMIAMWAAIVAYDQGNVAVSRELAIKAITQLSDDPDQSIRLAVHAIEASQTIEAQQALRESLSNRQFHVLRGHTGLLTHAAFSPDGRWIVTAGADYTARLWEAATGQPLMILQGHVASVFHAAFSPDRQWVVTAGVDRTARVWEVATGRAVRTLKGHRNVVQHAAFSPESRSLLTTSWDHTAAVWDVATERAMTSLRGHTEEVTQAAFSPDGKWIVTASVDRTARIWEAATGQAVAILHGHTQAVRRAAFSPDGRWVVTASDDATARVWGAATGEAIVTFQGGHAGNVTHAAFSPDGKWVVTAGVDHTARVWEAATGQAVKILQKHTDRVRYAAFSPDGRWIVTASDDGTARIWEAASGQALRTLHGHAGAVTHAAFSPDSRWVVTVNEGIAQIFSCQLCVPTDELLELVKKRMGRLGGSSACTNIVTTLTLNPLMVYRQQYSTEAPAKCPQRSVKRTAEIYRFRSKFRGFCSLPAFGWK